MSTGEYIDKNNGAVKYTDIDYNIFSDGARLMWEGRSPYDRETYRYPPILAFILIPNQWIGCFGKILFVLADVGVVHQCNAILQLGGSGRKSFFWALMTWSLNPLAASICTRGSLDSINNWMVLRSLALAMSGKHIAAGAILGLAIHFRIYPVIFLPALFVHALLYIPPTSSPISRTTRRIRSHSAPLLYTSSIPSDSTSAWVDRVLRRFETAIGTLHVGKVRFTSATRAVVATVSTLFVMMIVSYLLYGDDYLQESLFYHMRRTDSKHNFSPHFLWMYLHDIESFSSHNAVVSFTWKQVGFGALKILTLAPQIVLFTLTTVTLARRDLPACFLVTSFVFVAFNKVCTAQYFTWFACFIPIVAGRASFPVRRSICVTCGWIIALALWLNQAYNLEFLGVNNFYVVWLCSLLFHIVSVLCIAFVINRVKTSIDSIDEKE